MTPGKFSCKKAKSSKTTTCTATEIRYEVDGSVICCDPGEVPGQTAMGGLRCVSSSKVSGAGTSNSNNSSSSKGVATPLVLAVVSALVVLVALLVVRKRVERHAKDDGEDPTTSISPVFNATDSPFIGAQGGRANLVQATNRTAQHAQVCIALIPVWGVLWDGDFYAVHALILNHSSHPPRDPSGVSACVCVCVCVCDVGLCEK